MALIIMGSPGACAPAAAGTTMARTAAKMPHRNHWVEVRSVRMVVTFHPSKRNGRVGFPTGATVVERLV